MKPTLHYLGRIVSLACLAAAAFPAGARAQASFPTAEDAIKTLTKAVAADDINALLNIFGGGAQEILSSGDPVADRWNREVLAVALQERWELLDLGTDAKEVVVGNERWPFPIPLARGTGGWHFDVEAGKTEVLARRIGRNELFVIGICNTFVRAQNEYAEIGHDGNPVGVYAQKVRSEAGKQNGLHWESGAGEKPSPLGPLAASASAEGYGSGTPKGPTPFHGYYFRILTAQGPKARGGSKNYIVDGKMTGGFALVAHPAEYGNSGIATFMVNQDGVVYEKDLGADTAAAVSEIKTFNPGRGWKKVD